MNLNIHSTIFDALTTLKQLGAASLKFSLNDGKDRPLTFVSVVRGKKECAEVSSAFNAIEDAWHNEAAIGTSTITWIDAAKELPDDNTRVMFACGGDTDEPGVGYIEAGVWFYDNDDAVDLARFPVYAWAHVPAIPPKPKKGGAS